MCTTSSTWNCLTSRWRRLAAGRPKAFPGPVGDALSWFAGFLILALPYLGRIAAPIFLFCIANGYRHTRSVKRYAQRIFLFGALAQIPYFLYLKAWEARLGEELYIPLNFMFTLGLGLLSIALYEREKEQNPSLALLAAFCPSRRRSSSAPRAEGCMPCWFPPSI